MTKYAIFLMCASFFADAESKAPQASQDYVISNSDSSSQKSNDEILGMLKDVEGQIKKEPPGPNRSEMLLAKASLELALARNFHVKSPRTSRDIKEEKKYLQLGNDDASSVEHSAGADNELKAKAMFYLGLGLSIQGDNVSAEKIYLRGIELFPAGEYAPIMSIFVAESEYDRGKYQDASRHYGAYFEKLPPSQQAVSMYKTAWCAFKLKDYETAEKGFTEFIAKKWDGKLTTNAVQDLAQVLASHRDDKGIIKFVGDNFKINPNTRLEILTFAYAFLRTKENEEPHRILSAEILRLEKDPAKKFDVLVGNLKFTSKKYATVAATKEFEILRDRMKSDKVTPDSAVFGKIREDLEMAMQGLIHSFIDTYQGRAQNPEDIPKTDLAASLEEFLSFHTKYFANSIDRVTMHDMWMDVCAEQNDGACLYEASHAVSADPNLAMLHRKARLENLRALEILAKVVPERKVELITELTKFYEEQESDKEWMTIAKKLLAMQLDDKKFSVAIPIAGKIDSKEKSSESRFRLLWTLFEGGKYSEVATMKSVGNDTFALDAKKIIEESKRRSAPKEVRTEPPAADLDWFSTLLESDKSMQKSDYSKIKSSSSKSRLYMLSILTLSRPEDSLSYFEEYKPNDDEEIKMQTLARQMKAQSWDLAPEDPTLEESLKAIQVPGKPESQMQIAKIAEEVRALRVPVARGIKGKSEAYAKRVLTAAVKVEEDVSKSYLKTPPPAHQSRSPSEEFKASLREVSQEFQEQANEYKKALKKITETEKLRHEVLYSLNFTTWPLPKSDLTNKLSSYVDRKNIGAALLAIDRARSSGDLSLEQYYALRTWILVKVNDTEFIRDYAHEELAAAKQGALLAQWAKRKE